MASVQSPLSARFVFDVPVEPEDIDVLGHVSNLVYVRWVQDAAWRHSSAVGWDHAAYVRLGALFVVRRHELDYLASAIAGDVARITTWVDSWSAASSIRRTEATRVSDGRVLLRAATTWAMVSAKTGRPTRIVPEIVRAFAIVDAKESAS
ncbi:MAG: acyl-CoA thioesterase [Polyangiales bacterium]